MRVQNAQEHQRALLCLVLFRCTKAIQLIAQHCRITPRFGGGWGSDVLCEKVGDARWEF